MNEPASCLLLHGPGARQAALDEANRLGRLVAPPFGDEGLKVADAREIVLLLLNTPVGNDLGVVIVGPVDEAWPKASDVLLKRLEEFPGEVVRPVLWANDIGGVSPTVRSRCIDRWVPGSLDDEEVDDALVDGVHALVAATLDGDWYRVPGLLRDLKGKEQQVLDLAAGALADNPHPDCFALWERLRQAARWYNPTWNEVLVAFLPEAP